MQARTFWLICGLLISALPLRADPRRDPEHDYEPPKPGTYDLPAINAAGDGQVIDSRGENHSLHEFTRGRVTVMSFIYTRCAATKACPYATGVLRELHQLSAEDPALARELCLVSISFDPGNDTPARMADYAAVAANLRSAASWHFLTTSNQSQLQPILDSYGQAVDKKSNPLDPAGPLNHTLRVFLIDRHGNIRNIYSSGTLDVRLVLADIRTLMLEQHSAAESSGTAAADRPAKSAAPVRP